MWLMDHQMNQLVADEFALPLLRLPLRAAATIRHGNALRIDWNDVLPAERCSYIMGNPPYVGKHYRTKAQNDELVSLFGDFTRTGDLDFVAGWIYIAAKYIANQSIRVAFVTTNSIAQGEQVAALWDGLTGWPDDTPAFCAPYFQVDQRSSGWRPRSRCDSRICQ